MNLGTVARRLSRSLAVGAVALTLAVGAAPGIAQARDWHGGGDWHHGGGHRHGGWHHGGAGLGIGLGILGGALAGAAIANSYNHPYYGYTNPYYGYTSPYNGYYGGGYSPYYPYGYGY